MTKLDYRHAVYAGSFDPITLGHTSIIERAVRLYDRVTVAVGVNVHKTSMFTVEQRVDFIERAVGSHPGLNVVAFEGLLVDFARESGAGVILRGLRMLTDFEGEFQLALGNRDLSANIETVFLMTDSEFVYVSSSLVKEIASNGGDISRYIPAPLLADVVARFGAKDAGG